MDAQPFDEHPWVLLTMPAGPAAAATRARWSAAGYEVFQCEGPRGEDDCPLVRGEGCPVADRAQLIVDGLPAGGRSAALRNALARRLPDIPVIDPS